MIGSQAEGIPSFATYWPGADTWMNASRRIDPSRGFIAHTTQGRDSRGLGVNRHHNTPGTFPHLLRDDAWYTFYPDWVRCSHAAGANLYPGVEVDMFTGERFTQQRIDLLGKYLEWRVEVYGRDQSLFIGSGPRVWIDQVKPLGTWAHLVVDYPPNRSYLHYDTWHPDDYIAALAGGGGSSGPGIDLAAAIAAQTHMQQEQEDARMFEREYTFGGIRYRFTGHVDDAGNLRQSSLGPNGYADGMLSAATLQSKAGIALKPGGKCTANIDQGMFRVKCEAVDGSIEHLVYGWPNHPGWWADKRNKQLTGG